MLALQPWHVCDVGATVKDLMENTSSCRMEEQALNTTGMFKSRSGKRKQRAGTLEEI